MNKLSQGLTAGVQSDDVITGVDEISLSRSAESAATATLTSSRRSSSATNRSLRRAEVDLSRDATAALPSPASTARGRVRTARGRIRAARGAD